MPQSPKRKAEYQRDFRNKQKGLQPATIFHLDNGSYIHISKLVDPKWRSLLTYLTKMRYPDGLRVGMFGPTISECKKLLQATA